MYKTAISTCENCTAEFLNRDDYLEHFCSCCPLDYDRDRYAEEALDGLLEDGQS
jgi:hypothetical protein